MNPPAELPAPPGVPKFAVNNQSKGVNFRIGVVLLSNGAYEWRRIAGHLSGDGNSPSEIFFLCMHQLNWKIFQFSHASPTQLYTYLLPRGQFPFWKGTNILRLQMSQPLTVLTQQAQNWFSRKHCEEFINYLNLVSLMLSGWWHSKWRVQAIYRNRLLIHYDRVTHMCQ